MPPPSSRIRFEHNIYLVLEEALQAIEQDNIENSNLWASAPHLVKARYLPNRRLDLPTVNEMLRLHGNTMDWKKYIDFEFLKDK
ncbi:hypothetical protein M23134_01539 [Microscilla marina ATCC 23134]|uniref:Uncharacterized protein n=2 Tax=Microscilla marina TaxID=1027 RepID=A1ZK26_MICM2|nr:hypothetical protein M23134_01539 [Microscilla marina ATCC 23134]